MPRIKRFGPFGITAADLDVVTAFFVGLGLEVDDVRATADELVADGYGVVGGIRPYEEPG